MFKRARSRLLTSDPWQLSSRYALVVFSCDEDEGWAATSSAPALQWGERARARAPHGLELARAAIPWADASARKRPEWRQAGLCLELQQAGDEPIVIIGCPSSLPGFLRIIIGFFAHHRRGVCPS